MIEYRVVVWIYQADLVQVIGEPKRYRNDVLIEFLSMDTIIDWELHFAHVK